MVVGSADVVGATVVRTVEGATVVGAAVVDAATVLLVLVLVLVGSVATGADRLAAPQPTTSPDRDTSAATYLGSRVTSGSENDDSGADIGEVPEELGVERRLPLTTAGET